VFSQILINKHICDTVPIIWSQIKIKKNSNNNNKKLIRAFTTKILSCRALKLFLLNNYLLSLKFIQSIYFVTLVYVCYHGGISNYDVS